MKLKDDGTRREFSTGAVRDTADGKGRCDLLPLDIIGEYLSDDIFIHIDDYVRRGNVFSLWSAITSFSDKLKWGYSDMILEVSKQYEDGAKKYNDRNWEKGISLHCYIDSGIRHYLKWLRGDTDEPHDRAFVWNMLGAIYTHKNKPEMIDLPFKDNKTSKESESKDCHPGSSVVNNESLYNHYAKLGKLYNIDYCVCCGDPLPEGRQVCYKCEKAADK